MWKMVREKKSFAKRKKACGDVVPREAHTMPIARKHVPKKKQRVKTPEDWPVMKGHIPLGMKSPFKDSKIQGFKDEDIEGIR